ncbi:MAG: NUDIX domain-containing protein [Methanoregulaceae archaeon]|nr:NUDIX domain-containing protein [Methanoregulaceae archaeon]
MRITRKLSLDAMSPMPVEFSGRALIFDQNGSILLLRRSEKSQSNPGKWEIPGGKPNPGESFEESLRREVREETGFEIDIHRSAGTADQVVRGYHVVHVILIASIRSGGLTLSDEHAEFRWMKIPELSGLDRADWFDQYYEVYLRSTAEPPDAS